MERGETAKSWNLQRPSIDQLKGALIQIEMARSDFNSLLIQVLHVMAVNWNPKPRPLHPFFRYQRPRNCWQQQETAPLPPARRPGLNFFLEKDDGTFSDSPHFSHAATL
jgi:hypothetical protein